MFCLCLECLLCLGCFSCRLIVLYWCVFIIVDFWSRVIGLCYFVYLLWFLLRLGGLVGLLCCLGWYMLLCYFVVVPTGLFCLIVGSFSCLFVSVFVGFADGSCCLCFAFVVCVWLAACFVDLGLVVTCNLCSVCFVLWL